MLDAPAKSQAGRAAVEPTANPEGGGVMNRVLEVYPGGPEVAAPDHAHRWRIEEPQGPTSSGRCRGCGELRLFRNSSPGDDLVPNAEHRATATGRLRGFLRPPLPTPEAEPALI